MSPFFRRSRPRWWPENEPWPPHGPPNKSAWRQRRRFFFWRVAATFLSLMLFTAGGCALTLWLTLAATRAAGIPAGAVPFFGVGALVGVMVVFALSLRNLVRLTAPV